MSLLFDDQPMVLLPSLAKELENLNEAVFLQQLHYWINIKKQEGKNYIEDRYWVFNSLDEWLKQFTWMSKKTLQRTINNLVEKGFIIKGNFNRLKMDQTCWYTIDYDRIREIEQKIEKERAEKAKMALLNNQCKSVMNKGTSSCLPDETQETARPESKNSPQTLINSPDGHFDHIDMVKLATSCSQNDHLDVATLTTSMKSDCPSPCSQSDHLHEAKLTTPIPEITMPDITPEISTKNNTDTTDPPPSETPETPCENGKDDENILFGNNAEMPAPSMKIIGLYNGICKSFPKVTRLTPDRERHIRARFREYGGDISVFENVFHKAEDSDFLSGRSKDWDRADFDWIIKPSNFAKIIEGKYDNTSERKKRALEENQRLQEAARRAMERRKGEMVSIDEIVSPWLKESAKRIMARYGVDLTKKSGQKNGSGAPETHNQDTPKTGQD